MKYTSYKRKDSGTTSLNICTWNVGGLIKDGKNKLNDHSFLTQINRYDIVLLSETHIGYDSAVESDKFYYYPFCRQKSNNNRYFGGLTILIDNGIKQGVAILQDGNSEYQWVKLQKFFFNLKKDIFLCFAYIASQSSPFLLKENINIIESIEHDIVNKYSSKGDIILCGDLNARLGKENYYIPLNSVFHIPVSNECYDIDIAVYDRNSQDTIVDARGRDIIDICIGNKLRILNGRTLGDSKGKYTCYKPVGCSVIDYFIVSET
jgi:exonuclease III